MSAKQERLGSIPTFDFSECRIAWSIAPTLGVGITAGSNPATLTNTINNAHYFSESIMTGFTKEARDAATIVRSKNAKIRKQAKVDAYFASPKTCSNPQCSNILNYAQACDNIRFCCRSCSNAVIIRLGSDESKQKVREALEKPKITQTLSCVQCTKIFTALIFRQTCSGHCKGKLSGNKGAVTKTERGTHPGWSARTMEPSYPEKYFISVFENEGITGWVREKKVGRWFIDFAFEDQKLAVEVDGRQHQDPERKESDERKDTFLTSQGWTVIRVQWSNPRSQKGKDALHPQVKALLSIIRESKVLE